MSIERRRFPPVTASRRRVVLAILAAFTVLALVAALSDRTLLRLDRPLQEWVVDARQGWLNDVMTWVSLLGTRYVIGALLLGLAAWTFVTGRCRIALLVLVVAFAVNPLVEWALKAGVDRVRPDLLPLGRGRGPSFPSGHVVASVGFYGALPVFVSRAGAASRARAVTTAVSVAVILAVGFSRMYIGVHWFTDVIGGFLIGAVLVHFTVRALRRHHREVRDLSSDGDPPGNEALPTGGGGKLSSGLARVAERQTRRT